MASRKAKKYRQLCEEQISHLMLVEWTPFERVEINGHPEIECWANSRYQVQVRRQQPTNGDGGELIWLSIRSLDRVACHDWREFQRIKNELAGPECEAIELYPAESRLTDGANQYHLWCFPGVRFGFGFNERLVTEIPEHGGPGHSVSVQRPFDVEPSSRQVVVHLNGDPRDNRPENERVPRAVRRVPVLAEGPSRRNRRC